jgi:acetylornithine aminotransferase/acetylornithine/N-succinyldiaminopimelate aminotransferase
MSSLLNVYKKFPITIVRGSGIYIYDDSGKKYLDFTSGIATVNFGHCNKYISEKVKEQINKLWHCSNLFNIYKQESVAERLISYTFADKLFFCSSGLEAIETAVKCIRRYFYVNKKPEKYRIITLQNGFHGRSMTGISAGGGEKAKEGFAPLLEGFDTIPAHDLDTLKNTISRNTAAILVELIQSEGGVYPMSKDYVKSLRQIADENNILLCFDEVQTGFGRVGKLFHYQNLGIEPDILTCAKGMGNGFPVSACLMKEKVADAMQLSSHGGTYSGNPIALTVVDAVLDVITSDGFLEEVENIGKYFKLKLSEIKKEFKQFIKEIRGDGLLVGIEFYENFNSYEFLEKCLQNGLAMTKTSKSNVIRILPPLIIKNIDIDLAISIITDILVTYT